jgi:phosphoglycerate dehydrogenase-like enzyme
MRIAACVSLTGTELLRLREATGDAEVVPAAGADGRAAFEGCEVAFGNPPADWLAGAPRLRWVQLESAGVGEYAGLDWQTLGRRLTVTNLAGFFAEPVAESILAGILAHYRGLGRLCRLQAEGTWQGDALRPGLKTLKGAAVVLLGWGALNRRVADLLAPFACQVTSLASRSSPSDLDMVLATADVVVCAVPDTPSTRGLFDRARLARMKRGSLFLNFGRGSLIDEEALADALREGRLAGAVLDVTRQEPLPADHRFWTSPNLLLTQHTGGGSGDEIDRKIDFFLANLARFRRGEPLQGRVDFERGY